MIVLSAFVFKFYYILFYHSSVRFGRDFLMRFFKYFYVPFLNLILSLKTGICIAKAKGWEYNLVELVL